MDTQVVVPSLGESVVEATVARWFKKEGDQVEPGEVLVELETDKVNLEVGAERAGVLSQILRQTGEDVKIGDVLGVLSESKGQPVQTAAASPAPETAPSEEKDASFQTTESFKATPSARRLAQEQGLDLGSIAGTGSGNQITRQDVETYIRNQKPEVKKPEPASPKEPAPGEPSTTAIDGRPEEKVRMSRRRQTIARRLVEAQHSAAMLTTYNEVNMHHVVELRNRHKESFRQKHGVNLGIVSFFVKASIGALKEFPPLNSEIQENDILYKRYYDIGIAIGAKEGLVVPVLRNADQLSFAQIEQAIKNFVSKSEAGDLTLEDLRGGTFTITNGGVFGSLLSTPILNPPQVAILGLHKIEERPVAVNGQILIQPMMYVALSYDHRVVDGRESVQFLSRLKALIEDPASLLF